MDARALDILRKHGFRAFSLYCYLLALGAGRGEVRTSGRRLQADCGMRTDTALQLLAGLEAAGAVRIRRDSGWLHVTVPDNTEVLPRNTEVLPRNTPQAARAYTHMRGGGRDQGLIHVMEEIKRECVEKKQEENTHKPQKAEAPSPSFQPPPRAEPAAFRYPETPEEVRAAAEMQGLAMTLEQARDFLEYHMAFGWTFRGSRVPPDAWRWRLRRWMEMENSRQRAPERPGDRASPGLDAGEGFDRIGF